MIPVDPPYCDPLWLPASQVDCYKAGWEAARQALLKAAPLTGPVDASGEPGTAAQRRVSELVIGLGDTRRIAEFLAAINALRDEDIARAAASLPSPPAQDEDVWTLRCEGPTGKGVVVLTPEQAERCRNIANANWQVILASIDLNGPPSSPAVWLVELGCSPPKWWTGRGDEWTPYVDGTLTIRGHHPDSAMRFARREDAERAIGWLIQKGTRDGCKATEHLWRSAPSPSAGAAQETTTEPEQP